MAIQNKEVVDRWFTEYWGELNPDVVDELGAEGMTMHYPLGGESQGREEVKSRITGYKKMFPDGGFELTADLVAEGDSVVACWEGEGTHTGPAWELPIGTVPEGSGKTVSYTGITVYRVRDAMVVSEYGEGDYLGVVQQLGLIDPQSE